MLYKSWRDEEHEETNDITVEDKAQRLADDIDDRYGFAILAYQNSELEKLRDALDQFLELGVETEELQDHDESTEDLLELTDIIESDDEEDY